MQLILFFSAPLIILFSGLFHDADDIKICIIADDSVGSCEIQVNVIDFNI